MMDRAWKVSFIAVMLLAIQGTSLAQQIAITDYVLPQTIHRPNQITVGPDGALWFTYLDGSIIGRITIAGVSQDYSIPSNPGATDGITTGLDGALWFCEPGTSTIGRITTAGAVTEYPLPTPSSSPVGIARGPDGALWFTENSADKIGRITTAGAISEYPVPTAGSAPFQIAAGPDGALWFTEGAANQIGRITTSGVVTEYPVSTQQSSAFQGIAAGPDNAMWFAEFWPGDIGRIAMDGAVTQYHISTYGSNPVGITPGPDGALWFAEEYGNKVGRITTAGVITDYAVPQTYPPPDQGPGPLWIATGPDRQLWFSEYMAVRIGEAVNATASLTVTPNLGAFQESVNFNGSMFAPNSPVTIFTQGIGSPALATAVTDSSGSFTAPGRIPQSSYGSRIFIAVGKDLLVGAASFQMASRMILNPQSGPPGTTVVAQGFGFYPYWGLNITWNESTTLGTASTDMNGTFAGNSAFTFTVPSGAQPGVYTVTAGWNRIVAAKVQFTVD